MAAEIFGLQQGRDRDAARLPLQQQPGDVDALRASSDVAAASRPALRRGRACAGYCAACAAGRAPGRGSAAAPVIPSRELAFRRGQRRLTRRVCRHHRRRAGMLPFHVQDMNPTRLPLPALRGGLLALLAAVLFGVSTPLVQRFGAGLGAFTTAALLYAGAALVGACRAGACEREARAAPRRPAPAAGHGGVRRRARAGGAGLGPAAHQRHQRLADADAGSAVHRGAGPVAVPARRWTAASGPRWRCCWPAARCWCSTRGAAASGRWLGPAGRAAGHGGLGRGQHAVARAGRARSRARWCWPRPRSAPATTALLAALAGEPVPGAAAALGLLAVGATGYGLSLRFYLLAQRAFGAARTGSVFAFAPFVGAALAVALGDRAPGWLMAAGRRPHAGRRGAAPGRSRMATNTSTRTWCTNMRTATTTATTTMRMATSSPVPAGPHSHPHHHPALRHAHPHVPDSHHAHRH